ncbi:MAG: ABC transporter ATP-binding protein [Syntrophomonadaceae bacterium]
MHPLLEIQNVSFEYPGTLIFEDIGFDLFPGEVFCVLGPNGSGKTTLLDCVLGWLKPSAGFIKLNGMDVAEMKARQIAHHVAYVPQIHEKAFPYRVRDVVLMGRASYLSPFAAPSAEDIAIADKAMRLVGITRLQERPYTQLSGGEGQLVMVARALAQNTPLIIMDEPTAHLDYHHELVIMETISKLVKNTGLSVLMATHMPNHCFYFENQGIRTKVAMLKNKHLLAQGPANEILSESNLGQLYNIKARIIDIVDELGVNLKQVIPLSTLRRREGSHWRDDDEQYRL